MIRRTNRVNGECLTWAALGWLTLQLAAAPAPIFQITSFTNLEYPAGFTGTVGTTSAWPAGMGWQGDTLDIAFDLPDAPPSTARHYRFRVVIHSQFEPAFDLAILVGPTPDLLTEAHVERVGSPRVLTATIPLDRFTPGQMNRIRLQGRGAPVGQGQPRGILWSRWVLSRTDAPLDLQEMIDDQLQRSAAYVRAAIQPNGLVRDSLTLSPDTPPFHPASPDAAGFALLALCAMDHLGLSPDAGAQAEAILSAYAGHTPGVTPTRNAKGHWWHWLNLATGTPEPGWHDNYTTIGSALLVAGALFASNHFPDNPAIAAHAAGMLASCDFDSMIHPDLDGRLALATDAAGHAVGYTRPWNEYMLIVSLARRQPGAVRAPAVAELWLNPDNAPKAAYRGIPTLTDRPGSFAPAFWVQQQYFFNPDFSNHPGFVSHLRGHQQADALYCAHHLGQNHRYGLTAGVAPSGYRADRLFDHDLVFSPSAVGAWGDLETLLEFLQHQPPGADPRSRYGLARVSSSNPAWWPADAGLVDHLFLMFGLVEARSPLFFRQRQTLVPASPRPVLKLVPEAPDRVTISWTPDTPGFALQQTTGLPPEWADLPDGTNNPVTLHLTGPALFYRLARP